MNSRKFVRRALLAAALASVPLQDMILDSADAAVTTPAHRRTSAASPQQRSSQATGKPAARTPGTRPTTAGYSVPPGTQQPIQQIQHQPAPGTAQGGQNMTRNQNSQPQQNSAVVNELNRLFLESGQQPPSMREQDLPYANSPRMNMVQKRQTPPPKKQNVFQKFVGRLKGDAAADKQAAQSAPSDQGGLSPLSAPAPGTMPGGSRMASSAMQAAPATPVPSVPPAVPRSVPAMAKSNATGQPAGMNPQAAQGRAVVTGGRPQALPTTASPMPRASQGSNAPSVTHPQLAGQPGRAVGQPQPAGMARPLAGQPGASQFAQPGTAPSFIRPYHAVPRPASQSVPVADAAAPQQRPAAAAQTPPVVTAQVPPASSDGFVDPFSTSGRTAEADEEMDLDSLIEIPAASREEANRAADDTTGYAVLSDTATSDPEPIAATPVQGNPFTGVRLDTSTVEAAEDTTGRATLKEASTEFAEGLSLPPVDEFQNDVPALEIPARQPAAAAVPASDEQLLKPRPTPETAVSRTESPAQSSATPAMEAERAQQAADLSRRERQRTQILARAGQSGFKGFCPVELRDRRELRDADPEITATFGLQSYRFSSAQAKAAFEADPSRYAPAAGGNDVVLLINSGEEQAGMLDYSLWYRDRLYMFRSRETMALFSRDPAKYANQY